MAKYDGVLVEVDGSPGVILQMLEDDDEVSLTEMCTATGESTTAVKNIIKVFEKLVCSITLATEERGGETYYKAEKFHELTGAHVPLLTVYEEREVVEKTKEIKVPVEVPVIKEVPKPYPVEVGSANKPKLVKKRRSSKKPARKKEGPLVWAGDPGSPEMPDPWIEPPWFSLMQEKVARGRHIALKGPPGCGKTTAVEALAAMFNRTLVNIPCDVGLHRRDMTGSAEVREGNSWFDVAQYSTAAYLGWWAKLDEVNYVSSDALGFLNGQLASPYQVGFHGTSRPVNRKDFRCFITYNEGLAGTKLLPQALLDRFTIFEVGYPDDDTLSHLLIAHGAKDSVTVARTINVAREVWGSRLKFQLSPRRLYDAMEYVDMGVELDEALKLSILPYVWLPSETNEVLAFLNRGLAMEVNLDEGMEVRK